MRLSDLFENLADQAAEHFGVTNNPRECGYLLADGRMLDLSGRHQMLGGDYRRVNGMNVAKRGPDYQNGLRLTDHRDLDELSEKGGTDGMFEFMAATGAIRVMPPIGFCLTSAPTRRQIATMCVMAQYFDDEVYLETYDEEGYVAHHMSYIDLNPAKVMAFLKKAGLARIA